MHMVIIAAVRLHHLPLIGAVILVSVPAPAHAQSFLKENTIKLIKKIAFHADLSYRKPLDEDVSKGRGYGASVGLAPGHHSGIRYPFTLSFYTQDLHSVNGDKFASVRTRGILQGIGYGWHLGDKWATGVQLQTGYSWNHGSLRGDLEHAFDVPSDTVSIHAGNSWVLRPEVKAEYLITPKFALRVAGDYVYSKPSIIVTTPNQRFERQWDQSNFHVRVGIAYYPFRKP
jgi:hypothetical protein